MPRPSLRDRVAARFAEANRAGTVPQVKPREQRLVPKLARSLRAGFTPELLQQQRARLKPVPAPAAPAAGRGITIQDHPAPSPSGRKELQRVDATHDHPLMPDPRPDRPANRIDTTHLEQHLGRHQQKVRRREALGKRGGIAAELGAQASRTVAGQVKTEAGAGAFGEELLRSSAGRSRYDLDDTRGTVHGDVRRALKGALPGKSAFAPDYREQERRPGETYFQKARRKAGETWKSGLMGAAKAAGKAIFKKFVPGASVVVPAMETMQAMDKRAEFGSMAEQSQASGDRLTERVARGLQSKQTDAAFKGAVGTTTAAVSLGLGDSVNPLAKAITSASGEVVNATYMAGRNVHEGAAGLRQKGDTLGVTQTRRGAQAMWDIAHAPGYHAPDNKDRPFHELRTMRHEAGAAPAITQITGPRQVLGKDVPFTKKVVAEIDRTPNLSPSKVRAAATTERKRQAFGANLDTAKSQASSPVKSATSGVKSAVSSWRSGPRK